MCSITPAPFSSSSSSDHNVLSTSLVSAILQSCTTSSLTESDILLPSSTDYTARQDSYWSNTAKSPRPALIVRPRSAKQVSAVLSALVALNQPFAVRSGGHTPYPGAANIQDGVTIDLGRLDWVRFDADKQVVDIGPGARWGQVYEELARHDGGDWVVAGGRDAHVGVAGLLLGGGKTFFTARRGWACDDVVQYEVVLADGGIVTASKDEKKDLFRALKGGMNNFGVVTNFRMMTFRCGKVWAGMCLYGKEVVPGAATALVDFTTGIEADLDSNLLCFFTYAPTFATTVVCAIFIQTAGVENAPAYDRWLALPSTANTLKMTSVRDLVKEYAIAPLGYYDTFQTACFKNDARIVSKASQLHDLLVQQLRAFIPDGDFVTQCLFQPLSKLITQRSVAKGGNVLGLEDTQKHDGLLFTGVVMVRTAEQDKWVYPKMKQWLADLRGFADTIEDGNQPWVFMAYADGRNQQDALGSYGPESVDKMRKVAARYDPDAVFQKLCSGGFKIRNIKLDGEKEGLDDI